ncbi:DEAD-like helicase superfamily domain containing protein [Synechococcus phage S-CAM7]|uniref:DEAD-like helicase superfamily domain containing protein n=1 Tax=Synechococcus phage S-CAM7 TaxID=1883368 RepID=A0A1D8KUC6_9CAUD|nr:DEAD-like helicase superfamily domain containing protein [Synechococcus phage S-CAM7]
MKAYPHQSRTLTAMDENDRGLIVIPTGGGKTFVMAENLRQNLSGVSVVVAPRILLAQQLFGEIDSIIGNSATFQHMFAYSGEAIEREMDELSPEQILDVNYANCSSDNVKSEYVRSLSNNLPLIIFTTYHSLNNVVGANIPIDRAYLDEAHNATSIQFSNSVKELSDVVTKMYSFTATPKLGESTTGRGNNVVKTFGEKIIEVPAKELVENGIIVPPMPVTVYTGLCREKLDETMLSRDSIIRAYSHCKDNHPGINHKILVAADGTKTINDMRTSTNLIKSLNADGCDVFMVTSAHGSWMNNTEIKSRSEFLNLLREYGSNPTKKIVVIHHSILSEGIDVPGMTGVLVLRNMNVSVLRQTIGRVLRMLKTDRNAIANGDIDAGDYMNYHKSYGLVMVPVHKDDGSDLDSTVGIVYNSIMGMGFTPEDVINEENVRGEHKLELPDDLKKSIQQKIKEVDNNWKWMYNTTIIERDFSSLLHLL